MHVEIYYLSEAEEHDVPLHLRRAVRFHTPRWENEDPDPKVIMDFALTEGLITEPGAYLVTTFHRGLLDEHGLMARVVVKNFLGVAPWG